MSVTLPPKGRDLRLDLFRGIANWAIFLDHIPDNIVNWITTRNYGFSDAADLFVFISGYTACFVYARMMLERGIITGGTRLIKRVWQIYVAHVLLLVVYLAEIGYLAQKSRALSVRPFRDRRVPRGALCAAQLGRLRTASLPAGDRMRATVARGFLRRNLSVVRRPFRAGRSLPCGADADRGEHHGHYVDDRRGLLQIMVQADGQIAAQADIAAAR